MKTRSKINSITKPVVRYDPSLNKYDDVVLFPKKLAEANEDLKNTNLVELIKEFEEKQKKHNKL